MSLDASNRPTRGGGGNDLWPKWMWIAVPVLVVVVVAGLWWAIFSPSQPAVATPTSTPTVRVIRNPPTQGPTQSPSVVPEGAEPTRPVLAELPTFTVTPAISSETPVASQPTEAPAAAFAVGAKAAVKGTGGLGLNMRSGAGTTHARVKTLADGTLVELVGGPTEANNYTWWEIRDPAGITGWVADDFLDLK